jgi:hypothetical protein
VSCEHDVEPLASIKGGKVLVSLSDHLIRKESARCNWLVSANTSADISRNHLSCMNRYIEKAYNCSFSQ